MGNIRLFYFPGHLYLISGNLTSSGPCPVLSLDCSDLLVLGGLFDGCLLTDDLLQPLQPGVLGAQVPHTCLAAME